MQAESLPQMFLACDIQINTYFPFIYYRYHRFPETRNGALRYPKEAIL